MTHFGKIESYDSVKESGLIAPEKGGEALRFAKADLQQPDHQPRVDQRYGYETSQVDGGKVRAVNLDKSGASGSTGDMKQGGPARAQ